MDRRSRVRWLLLRIFGRLASYLAVFSAFFIAALGLCEIYFTWRYGESSPGPRLLAHSPELGWDSNPSFREIPPPSGGRDGAVKVVFLGDSFTQHARWPRVASQLAEARGLRIDGRNLGVSGHGTLQTYLKLERHIEELRPRLAVLLAYAWNDMRDNLGHPAIYYAIETRCRPYIDTSSGSIVRPACKPAGAIQHSHVFELLYLPLEYMLAREISERFGVEALHEKRIPLELPFSDEASWRPFYLRAEPPNAYVEAAWRATETALVSMRDLLSAHGGELLMIGLDNPFTVDRDVFDQHLAGVKGAEPDLPLARLAALAGRLGIRYTDAVPELRALSREGGGKVFKGKPGDLNGHLRVPGDRLIGAITARMIEEALSSR